jgi:hypothetical protein
LERISLLVALNFDESENKFQKRKNIFQKVLDKARKEEYNIDNEIPKTMRGAIRRMKGTV